MPLYKIVFLGMSIISPEEEERLLKGLQKKFHLSPEKAESLLQRVPIVVKRGINKEEMERYVKAFEEIGGRVRVEEEASPQIHEFRETPEIDKRPYTGQLIKCPQCGYEQPETDECIKCGVIISKYIQYQEMARSIEGKVKEILSEEASSPWESGEGIVWAFLRTTRDCLFSPTKFFKNVAKGEGYWSPLIYGIICGIIGFGVALVWQWLFLSTLIPLPIIPFISYNVILLVATITLPFMMAFSIVVGSAITHLCLMIVGGNKNGYQATFRAISYAWCGNLFEIIPFIGSAIGSIYTLILTIIGIRETHGISTGKSALAVLLPVIVIFILIIAAILIPLFLFGKKFIGGVGV